MERAVLRGMRCACVAVVSCVVWAVAWAPEAAQAAASQPVRVWNGPTYVSDPTEPAGGGPVVVSAGTGPFTVAYPRAEPFGCNANSVCSYRVTWVYRTRSAGGGWSSATEIDQRDAPPAHPGYTAEVGVATDAAGVVHEVVADVVQRQTFYQEQSGGAPQHVVALEEAYGTSIALLADNTSVITGKGSSGLMAWQMPAGAGSPRATVLDDTDSSGAVVAQDGT